MALLMMKQFIKHEILLPMVPFKKLSYIHEYCQTIHSISQHGSTIRYKFWLTYFFFKICNMMLLFCWPTDNELNNLLVLNYFDMMNIPDGYMIVSLNIICQFFYLYRLMHLDNMYHNNIVQLPFQVLFQDGKQLFFAKLYKDRIMICKAIRKYSFFYLNLFQTFTFTAGL